MHTPSLVAALPHLQIGQLEHDGKVHQDILHLVLPRRLTHFTLHFAKYQGGLYGSLASDAKPARKRLITDSMIIALAAANGVKMDLQTVISRSIAARNSNLSRYCRTAPFSELVGYYIETVGRMAKACEALDHLEDFPTRQVVERSVVEITLTVLAMSQVDNFDLQASVEKRWRDIEKESKFITEDAPTSIRHLARA